MPPERIVPLPSSENFWSVGGPGPCGPDSEIYWDWGAEHGCGEPSCAPACPRCDRFLEFWNLVFMEYEQHPDGTLTPLPAQNIDTGMGLERLAAIMQDVRSVYETDGYQAIMDWVAQESGVAFGESEAATKAHRDPGRPRPRDDVPRRRRRHAVERGPRLRAAPDHPPRGPAGAHDRARRPLAPERRRRRPDGRRGSRSCPENRERIRDVLRAEEERFTETLARGMKLFEEVAARGAISGKDAFDLSTTYGFPFELTRELALERGLPVDEDDFQQRMAEHREISRGGRRPRHRRARRARRPSSSATTRPRC